MYDLFQRGKALLEGGNYHAATVPLAQAAYLRPERHDYKQYRDQAFRRAA